MISVKYFMYISARVRILGTQCLFDQQEVPSEFPVDQKKAVIREDLPGVTVFFHFSDIFQSQQTDRFRSVTHYCCF